MTKMLINAFKINVVEHQMSVNRTKQNDAQLRLFFISDIHRREINERLIKKIEGKIDLVIIGGDLVEKGVPISRVLKNLENLSRLAPVFFVWGNNDREVGEEKLREVLAQANVKVLDNESFSVPGHSAWGICGTDDVSSRNLNIEKTVQDVKLYEHLIFVTHQPKVFTQAEAFIDPVLMLAGHTHGGQIRIGKLGLFENGAFISTNGRTKLISNGFGTSTVPLRFGAVPECHIITISYAESVFEER